MSSDKKQNAIETKINALPSQEIQSPSVPVKDLVQEGENLYHWTMADREALAGAGLDVAATIDLLPQLATKLRITEGAWYSRCSARADAQQKWKQESPKAYDLRDFLLHAMLHAYRNRPDVLSRVRNIGEGGSNGDMIQDLANSRAIGEEYPEELKAINFDFSLLKKAAETAEEMSDLLAAARAGENEARIERDRVYTVLKNIMSEIRECGRYVFYRNKDRVKGYASEYYRRHNRTTKKDPESPDTELRAVA